MVEQFLHSVKSSVFVKIIFLLTFILISIFLLITYMNVYYQTKIMMARQSDNAQRIKELVLSAMRYPMLNGDQDVIQKQFDEYGRNFRGKVEVHLTDETGLVRRSTSRQLLERSLRGDTWRIKDPFREFSGIQEMAEGGAKRPVYGLHVPIRNEESCFPCHGSQKPALGSLHMYLDWGPEIVALSETRLRNMLVSLAGVLLISFFTIFFLFRSILYPLKQMHGAMQKVAAGDFSVSLEPNSRDEIGSLMYMFNSMSLDLGQLMTREKSMKDEAVEREENLLQLNSQLQEEIEERRRIADALFKSEERYRGLIENLPLGVYRNMPDFQGKFLQVNSALLKILGYDSVEEIINLPVADMYVDIKDREELLARIKSEGGLVRHYEVRLRKKNGDVVWGSINDTAQFDEDGHILWLDGILEDITERKTAEEKLRTAHRELTDIIEFMPDSVFVINIEGKVIAWNRAMEEMSGIKKDDMLGKGEYCYAVPFYGKAIPVGANYVLERDMPVDKRYIRARFEGDLFHADVLAPVLYEGKGAYVNVNASVLYDSEGRRLGAIETIRDITARVEFERKIEQAAYEWRATFDCIPEFVSVINMELMFIRVNRPLADFLKKKPEELIGVFCGPKVVGVSMASFLLETHRMAVDTRQPVVIEVFDQVSQKNMEVTAAPIFDENGVITAVVNITQDISSRKELEKKERLAQLGKLVADMAHEVNNPLMIISGNAQLSLMEDFQNAEVKHNLEVIVSESRRAKDIIQRLLKFSRPSSQVLKEADINANIESVVNLIEHQFSLVNITIIRRYGGDLPLLTIDEKQMQEVFLNLLTNAREAMEKGGTVTLTTARAGDFVRIDVADTGSGMSEDTLKRVMEPFFTTKEKGTGLGLSVCYGIVKTHGGEIKFESAVGKGTIASIFLPVKGGTHGV